MRTRLLALTSAALLGLASPAAAQAVLSEDEIADEVLADGVFVDPAFDVDVDEAALEDAVGDSSVPVFVALLGSDQLTRGNAPDVAVAIGRAAGDSRAALLLVSDEPYAYADNGNEAADQGVDASSALSDALGVTQDGRIDGPTVTALVERFAANVDAQASGRSARGSGSSSGSGGSALPWVLGLGAVGAGAYALTRRKRKRAHAVEMEDLRADVESLYGRLGNDVQTLAPGDDGTARQALADAAERYNATGALMAKADTPGEWAAARRTAVEGLTAARVVRQRLGLDPGPEIPMTRSDAPQLQQHEIVQVGEEQHEGSPTYEPGRPHYFEGGYYGGATVPGGWYATPFWQTLLIGSMLGGGRRGYGGYGGGGYYGGGYGGGYSGGYSGGFGGGVFGGGGGFGGGGRRRSGGFGGRSSGGWSGRSGGGGWGGGGGGRRRGGGGW